MLKVYTYCLSEILIIDKDKNTISYAYAGSVFQGMGEIEAKRNTKKITKATIRKHIEHIGEFVVGVPILNEYAPKYLRSYDVKKGYIGEFQGWTEMKEFFEKLYEVSKPFFEKYSSCNKWTDIIDCYVKIKRGLSDWDMNFYEKHISDEKSWFHQSAKREKTLIDLLQGVT